MKKLNLLILTFSLLLLSNCGTVRKTKTGYRIKGEVLQTILTDEQLNGKCKISGLVYSRNDSTFLSAANIIINENSGTTSNKQGEFELELSPGTYNIRTTYIGHDELRISELELLPNQHAILIFQLGTTAIY
jgi:hypothetical protein